MCIEESVLLQVVCTGPLTCELHKKVHSFFLWCGKVGGVFGEVGGGVHVSGGRGLHGVSEGGGVI